MSHKSTIWVIFTVSKDDLQIFFPKIHYQLKAIFLKDDNTKNSEFKYNADSNEQGLSKYIDFEKGMFNNESAK